MTLHIADAATGTGTGTGRDIALRFLREIKQQLDSDGRARIRRKRQPGLFHEYRAFIVMYERNASNNTYIHTSQARIHRTHIHTPHVYTYTHTHTHTHARTHARARTHTHTHTHTRTSTHTRTHEHARARTNTHAHAGARASDV